MKRLVIINLILILILYIIPQSKITKEENIKDKEITEQIQISNRGLEEKRNTKNLNIDVNLDLRILSNLTKDDYNKMLSNTELKGLGMALEKAEKEYGVNGLYLMGLACLESGYRNI